MRWGQKVVCVGAMAGSHTNYVDKTQQDGKVCDRPEPHTFSHCDMDTA